MGATCVLPSVASLTGRSVCKYRAGEYFCVCIEFVIFREIEGLYNMFESMSVKIAASYRCL